MDALQTVAVTCPYCGEPGELWVETLDTAQAYVEDCAVCCRPWQVRVITTPSGQLEVEVGRDDDA